MAVETVLHNVRRDIPLIRSEKSCSRLWRGQSVLGIILGDGWSTTDVTVIDCF